MNCNKAIFLLILTLSLTACAASGQHIPESGVSDTFPSEQTSDVSGTVSSAPVSDEITTEAQTSAPVTATPETTPTAVHHTITPAEAYEMMQNQTVTVVDVRTPSEYATGHIVNAISIPNESIGDEAPEALPDKDAVLLIYCRSGKRSYDASEKLLKLGYQNIYDFGGIIDWEYETVAETD